MAQTLVRARTGQAVRVARGDLLRVTDLAGQQVGDLFAFALPEAGEYLSASHTRTAVRRLFPAVGESFVTNRRRPILTLVEDTSPGYHDLLIAACDEYRYDQAGHPSCAANLADALESLGLASPVVPQPVNLFMRVGVSGDRLDWLPAATRPGDSITFQAELDCVVALSACPQDRTGINGTGPTDLILDVLEDLR